MTILNSRLTIILLRQVVSKILFNSQFFAVIYDLVKLLSYRRPTCMFIEACLFYSLTY